LKVPNNFKDQTLKGMVMNRVKMLSVMIALTLSLGGKMFAQDKQIEIFSRGDDGDDSMMILGDKEDGGGWADMGMMMGSPMEFGSDEFEMNFPMMPPDELNLTKDQLDKIKKIHNTVRKQNIPIKSDIQLKRIELKELLDNDTPDKEKVAAKLKDIEGLRTQLNVNRINGLIDFKNVLTKDQKDKLEKMRMERRHGWGRKFMRRFKEDGGRKEDKEFMKDFMKDKN
jgi:Spy/CpxP family protein refolding chaperone